MNSKRTLCPLVVSVLVFAVMFSRAAAMDNDAARASLRGIEAVRVAVEELSPEIVKDGLNSDQIHTAVEQQLREAGIKVAADEKLPFLLVSFAVAKSGRNSYLYTVRVELYQTAVPYRLLAEKEGEPPARHALFASTWSSAGGMGSTANLEETRTSVKSEVTRFVEAFKASNR